MIPAIQAFFEILNYYANLAFQVFGYIWTFFGYIGSGVVFLYQLFALLPVWLQIIAFAVVAYLIIMFIAHLGD